MLGCKCTVYTLKEACTLLIKKMSKKIHFIVIYVQYPQKGECALISPVLLVSARPILRSRC